MRYNGGMSTMIAEVYDAFLAAGADEQKARAAAQAVARLEPGNYATKTDLEKLAAKTELEKFVPRAELEKFATKADLQAAVENLATKEDLAKLRVEMFGMRSEMFKWGAAAVLTIVAAQSGIAYLIVSALQQ